MSERIFFESYIVQTMVYSFNRMPFERSLLVSNFASHHKCCRD